MSTTTSMRSATPSASGQSISESSVMAPGPNELRPGVFSLALR
jgi:hypothetical protein